MHDLVEKVVGLRVEVFVENLMFLDFVVDCLVLFDDHALPGDFPLGLAAL